ncbi:MAG: glyceraldehyde-3-phosphate dehydrogenase [Desulfobacteraceae bacterium]|nr:glyceraldehyde-3-phosphate dehydrogenase [Desulfobacteraceae bacterium]MBC2754091.1 glyceraldehyde-3-phosphate dehydrogenase [Desulfobacteraceae bacterium]
MIRCLKKISFTIIIFTGIIFCCHSTALADPLADPAESPDAIPAQDNATTEPAPESSDTASEKPSLADLLIDPQDGALDVSAFLATAKGFLPIGGIITEPAVGYGGVLGLMFLHDSIQNRAEQMKKKHPDEKLKRLPPPSITGVGGFLTKNNSRGGGLFHMHIFKDDKFRYLGGLVYMDMNLDYYGRGGDLQLPVDHLSYTLDGYYLLQQLAYRVGNSHIFLGANYQFASFDTKIDFGLDIEPPDWFPPLEKTINSGGMGIFAEYDTRNSIFTPDAGMNVKIESVFYEEIFGSDRDFNKSLANIRGWVPFHSSLVLGLRTDTNFSSGDIPFYMLPFVNLRGISLTRYQGQYTVTSEAELRWDVTNRWSLLGFFGCGWVADDELSDFSFKDGHIAGGFGFRYFISNVFGIRTGMDFAWSEDEFAFYFTTGTAWGQK